MPDWASHLISITHATMGLIWTTPESDEVNHFRHGSYYLRSFSEPLLLTPQTPLEHLPWVKESSSRSPRGRAWTELAIATAYFKASGAPSTFNTISTGSTAESLGESETPCHKLEVQGRSTGLHSGAIAFGLGTTPYALQNTLSLQSAFCQVSGKWKSYSA